MATSADFMEYVCSQITEAGVVESKKMFGEYCIYLNGKAAMLLCDNTAFVKKMPCIEHLMAEAECGPPYPGAKEHYILDPDDRVHCLKVLAVMEPHLPYPKKRTSKKNSTKK